MTALCNPSVEWGFSEENWDGIILEPRELIPNVLVNRVCRLLAFVVGEADAPKVPKNELLFDMVFSLIDLSPGNMKTSDNGGTTGIFVCTATIFIPSHVWRIESAILGNTHQGVTLTRTPDFIFGIKGNSFV